ncbi:hypothetical protein RND81_09G182300 [Saponaria officinalis]|uniref:Uncharacterized protein n=1 Tax=Saponaria officinalis TaxID=3572 RepID=A0AAW1IND7_SAPOF
MENPRSPLLCWPYYYQLKSMEELKHTLVYTTMELESTRVAAQEEITKREEEITHLQQLLTKAIKERDESQEKCQKLLLEKVLLHQNPRLLNSGTTSSIEDEHNNVKKDVFSSSDCEESIVSSPPPPTLVPQIQPERPLPEKGKLLQAVMNAGPLLQTLLLAGPLPQWRHPPPPLETFEIPPVQIPASTVGDEFLIINGSNNCGIVSNKKRSFAGISGDASAAASSEIHKYQRVLFP